MSAQSGSMMWATGDPRPTATATATAATRSRAVATAATVTRSGATTVVTMPDYSSSQMLDEANPMLSPPIAVAHSAKETGGIAGCANLRDCLRFRAEPPAARSMEMTRYFQHSDPAKDRGSWKISFNGQHEETGGCQWLTDKRKGIQFLDKTSGTTRHVRCRLCNAVFFGKYKREYETGCPFHPSKLQTLWQRACPQLATESVTCQIENLKKFLTALKLFPSTTIGVSVDVLCIITNEHNALRACWTSGQHGGHARAELHVAIMHTQHHGWVAVTEVKGSAGDVGFRFHGRLPGAIHKTARDGLVVRYILPIEFDVKMRNQPQTHASSGPTTPLKYAGSTTLVRALSLSLGRHWGPLHAREMKSKLRPTSSVTPPRGKRSLHTHADSDTPSKRLCFKEVTRKDVQAFFDMAERIAEGLHRNKMTDAAREKILSLGSKKRWLYCKQTFNRYRKPNTTKFSSSGILHPLRPSASPPSATAAPGAFPPDVIALYRAVTMVTCLTSDGKVTYSTATCVCERRGFFLTVRHAFPDDLDDVMLVFVHQYCPTSNRPKLVCWASVLPDCGETLDIAMLVAWCWSSDLGLDGVRPTALPLERSATPPVPPTQIRLVGFPEIDGDDDLPYMFKGSICAPTTANYRGDMTLKLDVTSYPGQSGAPVINRNGKLLGVMTEAPGKDAKGGGGVKFAQWLGEHAVSFLERVSSQLSSDWVTSEPVAWTGEQQTMRESKPKASAPSTPTATRASAPFFTPTPARASAPNPRHSAAAVSGGAGHNTSGSSMRDQILSVMRQQPAGVSMTAIEIAKSLGG